MEAIFLDPIVIKVYIGDNNEYGKLEFEVSFFFFEIKFQNRLMVGTFSQQ